MIGYATETPIKTCNMSLAGKPPYNDYDNAYMLKYIHTYNNIRALISNVHNL